MKPPRLTTQRLAALIASVAVVLGSRAWVERRAARFRSEEARHLEAWLVLAPDDEGPGSRLASEEARVAYHLSLAEKYARAARSPWLPVAADVHPTPDGRPRTPA